MHKSGRLDGRLYCVMPRVQAASACAGAARRPQSTEPPSRPGRAANPPASAAACSPPAPSLAWSRLGAFRHPLAFLRSRLNIHNVFARLNAVDRAESGAVGPAKTVGVAVLLVCNSLAHFVVCAFDAGNQGHVFGVVDIKSGHFASPVCCGLRLSLTVEYSLASYQNRVKPQINIFSRRMHTTTIVRTSSDAQAAQL